MKTTKKQHGFTLIEVVIVLAIASTALAAVMSGIISANRLSYSVAQHQAAWGLCQERFEQMRAADDFWNITTTNFTDETDLFLTHLGGSTKVRMLADRTVQIENFMDTPVRKRVTIDVDWEYRGTNQNERLQGMIYLKR